MAKIQYSALVNKISGSIQGGILRTWKGIGIISKKNNNPRQPRSEKQQNIRGMLNELAGEYYSLTSVQKELWDSWVAMFKLPMTGLNAYVKFNQVIQKYLPGSARKTSPPATPATPNFPTGFTVNPQTGLDFCVVWTSPTLTTIYVIADYWAMPGRDSTTRPRWTFGATAGSDATFIPFSPGYPEDTVVKFRIRTMDEDGRLRPWSHILSTAATV